MSWRTTGILFIVLVAVGALVYFQSRQDEAASADVTPTAPTPSSVSIFEGVTVDNVRRLEITSSGGQEVSLSREAEGGWVMTVPTATTVISQTVTNSVTGLMNMGSRRTFAPEENPLDAYGLEDPDRQIVVVVGRDGEVIRYQLDVGSATPADDAYYVLRQGDGRVHLMTKSTLDRIFELATDPPLPESLPTEVPTIPITGTETITATTPLTATTAPSPTPTDSES